MLRIKDNILATLAYFDMFDYPLTFDEIYAFLENSCEPATFRAALEALTEQQLVFHIQDYYSLKNNTDIAARRSKGNRKALELLHKAERVGAWLIRFPYVRGIGVSGSLSKNFADENSDIDLFIITQRNRLWIARSIMHCFKKLTFLVNKQHYYCMNYYVDEAQLQIVEKNIYTAIEVVTLIPLQGRDAFTAFYNANDWAHHYLPNKDMDAATVAPLQKHSSKSLVEKILNNGLGNWMENVLMKITAKRWHKKTLLQKLNLRGTVMSMSASAHVAKPDPGAFQEKLIERYERKVFSLLEQSALR
ncbi:hypothetical protein F0L74_22670 [Chitinophaga agrisoli]|uniref:Polymerase nucleotidyl transferase domain-containing protein n=1 Tax=Chitinophaga agrisoli TaxID=2607653 RepID=A0A5B2VLE5_9BACT|nr:nucleotidyltransferase domain-containing protein [Chitinophaga agrisoli]KAA2239019.1 hypothetical protein F0L74_22670 [Chitinophaga agrisoli]